MAGRWSDRDKGQTEFLHQCIEELIRTQDSREQNRLGGLLSQGFDELARQQADDQLFPILDKAIKQWPYEASLHKRMAQLLERGGKHREALFAFATAGKLGEDAEALGQAARLALLEGRKQQASTFYRLAHQLVNQTSQGHIYLALALSEEGNQEQAIDALRFAVSLEPNNAFAYEILGLKLQEAGQIEEAIESYRRAIELTPSVPSPYFGLFTVKRADAEDRGLLDRARELFNCSAPSSDARKYLGYALGKAYDDLAEYESAISYFDEANRAACDQLKSRGAAYDPEQESLRTARIIETFSSSLFGQRDNIGNESEKPVFIVGMMRSGTTLAEQILSSHPDVAPGGELTFWTTRSNEVLRLLEEEPYLSQIANEYLRLLDSFGQSCRATDKMPTNFRYLGLIHLALPNARIIHCCRNPLDTCLSIYTTPNRFLVEYAHDRESLAHAYIEYLRLMGHWRRILPQDRFLEIDYERIVQDPEPTIREMVAFCGLQWSDSCLEHEKNERLVQTPSVWQVRQRIYSRSVGRWKNYERWLGPLMRLAGFNLSD